MPAKSSHVLTKSGICTFGKTKFLRRRGGGSLHLECLSSAAERLPRCKRGLLDGVSPLVALQPRQSPTSEVRTESDQDQKLKDTRTKNHPHVSTPANLSFILISPVCQVNRLTPDSTSAILMDLMLPFCLWKTLKSLLYNNINKWCRTPEFT